MADRNLNFDQPVQNEVPVMPDTALIDGVAQIGATIADQSAQAKGLAAVAETQVGLRQIDAAWRQKYAGDPTNAQGIKELQAARKQLTDQIGGTVPAPVLRQYTGKALELSKSADASNQLWTSQQQVRNTISNMQTSRVMYLQEANVAGRDFGSTDNLDLSTALNYVQANESIKQFATPIVGEPKVGEFLKSFNTDYVKSFVSGVAEINPKRAAELLDDPTIQANFTTKDRGDMAELIKRTQRQQELTKSLQSVVGTADTTALVNDSELSYFDKRAEIDRLDMEGVITPKAAAAARRVISSAQDLEAQTSAPIMAEIIDKVYSLNADPTLKPGEYLTGIRNIQDRIIALQADGQLQGSDATRLNNEIKTLTGKRQSDATVSVGYTFRKANDKFKSLPVEYRGEATRQLFYFSNGQERTEQELSIQAGRIVDQINQKRRSEALSIAARLTDDNTFLQSLGYTREQLTADAAAKGISFDQGIQALRSKYKSANKRARTVTRAARQDEEPMMSGNDAGISDSVSIPDEPVDVFEGDE